MKIRHSLVPILAAAALSVILLPDASAGGARTCRSGLPGPALVLIDDPVVPFCIDAQEVTLRDYSAFAATAPPEQSAECKGNTRFVPLEDGDDYALGLGGYCPRGIFDPQGRGDDAATCVDWCDAKAYCEWAGKRLCGARGGAGQALRLEARTAVAASEWQYACTGGGAARYAYGASYVPGRCVDESTVGPDPDKAKLSLRGSSQCTGSAPPYDRVTNMVGNVREWTASCDGDECAIQGGSFSSREPTCDDPATTHRMATMPGVGFRCCADVTEMVP